jgi:hypothetical protein
MAENTGAAFGVFPQMRPRRAQQDREAAANAPLSLLRGWAAGTAGLPGDIEGLVRMLTPGVSNDSVLPTSEFYKEWLPGRSLNETPTGRAFTEAGSLTGGAGVGPLSKLAATGVRAGARNLAVPTQLSRQAGVIKAPGGNWLSGSVEDSLRGLKTPGYRHINDQGYSVAEGFGRPMTAEELVTRGPQPPQEALNNWIDKQLTRYVKNEMATPGDPIRALAEKWAVDKPAKLAEVQGRIDALGAKVAQVAGERGVPPEYLTSMRQQMIGLEKEKALLQLREGSHAYTPEGALYGDWLPEQVAVSRMKAGFPIHGVSVSPVARAWENASDAALDVSTAGKHTLPLTESEIRRGYLSNVDKNPWLLKVPPETPVYYPEKSLPEELGFNHLIDELRNATNPESGLPAELLLKYKDLPKITVPQAVERVADINAWRAAQKVEADMARANNPATQVFKEYPEQGMKWVELKTPESSLPEGTTVAKYGDLYHVMDDAGNSLSVGATEKEAIKLLSRADRESALADALKYEGDTMQHCVGGYCPDVIEGRSRIYSLRDSKGQPQVTVEVKPYGSHNEDIMFAELTDKLGRQPNAQELSEAMSNAPQRIVQIKGRQNRAPGQEYLPFVQDFVKSGKWSDVGDIENAGLRRTRDVLNDLERETLRGKGHEFGDYMTTEERQGLQQMWDQGRAAGKEGFAAGGMVATSPNQGYNQARVDELADSLLAELF